MAPLGELKTFDMSRERGFLPDADPLLALPREFAAWEELARELPKLFLTDRLRARIDAMPRLTTDALRDPRERSRAMLLLSYLGHAYVWGEATPATRLPACLAVPWHAVAQELGRPPVLSYASYALDNWRRLDPQRGIELGNIMLVQNFLGGADEDWFIDVHIDIEQRAARVLAQAGPVLDAARARNVSALCDGLHEVAAGTEDMVHTLERMPEHCDPYIYYHRVRPYIHGWRDHPALPQGVLYDGVGAYDGRGQKFRGETGAQSGIVPSIDALLGVSHADDPLRTYLMEMRDYIPPGHRRFIQEVERASIVRPFVQESARSEPQLREAYNECIHWLESFRTTHLEYAATYIFRQNQTDAANPTDVGTGGTPFMTYLKKHRDESASQRI